MMICPALPVGAGFIGSIVGYLDCQAQILGSGAWQALAAPGSTLSVVLAAFLTVFVALIGYNLLLGQNFTVRNATIACIKIGAVLALATSWPAYRTLIYDLVISGPAQLVAEIGPRAHVVGSDGTLLQRLDIIDRSLAQLAVLGPGNVVSGQNLQLPPPPWVGFNAFALGGSRILFLLTVIAGFSAVRIVAGLMLALGPFFIAFLMFDGTRSLFEGWLRVLGGTALATIGVSIALGLELALMEPWIADVLARRMAGVALPAVPSELFVLTTLFTVIVLAALFGCARVARAFRLPPLMQLIPSASMGPPVTARSPASNENDRANSRSAERSRAAVVAGVVEAMGRRETGRGSLAERRAPTLEGRSALVGAPSGDAPRTAMGLGRTYSRRPGSRVSKSANRRDAVA